MAGIKWPGISRQPNGIPPAPILVVCVGTAGYTRGRNFCQHMSDSERIQRIQSIIVCDYNSGTMNDVWRSKVRYRGQGRVRGKDATIAMITPQQQNTDDGFTLNPLLFQDNLGAINRDLDNIVAAAQSESTRKGRDPQVILEFMGFGGHSIIGVLLHQKLRAAYPAAKMFPVIGIPSDLVLKQWMVYEFEPPTGNAVLPSFARNGVYRAYVEGLGLRSTEAALFVDNAVDTSPNHRLSAGLATIEAAGTDQVKGGSIPEALGGVVLRPSPVFPGDTIQKLNMNVARVQLEQDKRKVRWSREQEPTYAIKKACWGVVTGNSLLDGQYVPATSANIYLSLPFKHANLASLREAVLEELQVEGFFQDRDANILIGSSAYASVPKGRYEVTATVLESLSAPPDSLAKAFAEYQPPPKTPEATVEYTPPAPPSENGVTESQPQEVA